MCGIAGIHAGGGRPVPSSLLLDMAGELRHRGPDGVGLYLDDCFGMVNTRLSIIDISGGDQPLGNEDGRFWVMQNGEIYNFPELTAELESLGHCFSTRCDTEVLAHAFEEWGSECLNRLNGEFAFALWDRKSRELFLARDRFGIRPLYLAELSGDLCFASEIKALLRHPKARREIDPAALTEIFTLWTTLPHRSAFLGVRELPPGHFMVVRPDGSSKMTRWWDLPFCAPEKTLDCTSGEMAEQVSSLLDDATRIRLRADVPVAVYVSGGLDSSITTALARRHTSLALQGFGVGFSDKRYDESAHQVAMAKALGVQLERIRIDGTDIARVFPRVIELAECPVLRTAPAPLLHLSSLVRNSGFKVVLTGEGADELFAGYNIFRETMIRRFWSRQPSSSRRSALLTQLYRYLPRSLSESGPFIKSFFGAGLQDTEDPLYSHRIRYRNTARSLRLLREEVLEAARPYGDPEETLIADLPDYFTSLGSLSRAQYIEIHTFMQGYLLHSQGDRMLMGNSVEGRFPFLDYRVAELAARIPERLRLRGIREKHLLRKAADGLVPKEVAERDKRPYRAPIVAAFMRPGAPDYVEELLAPAAIEDAGIFSSSAVERLVAKCRRDSVNISETDEMALVGVLSTMLLHLNMVARPMLAPPAQPTKVVEGDLLHETLPGHAAP